MPNNLSTFDLILSMIGSLLAGLGIPSGWKYLTQKNTNKTTLEATRMELERKETEDLKNALQEIKELNLHLLQLKTAMDMLLPILKSRFSDDLEMTATIKKVEDILGDD